MGQISRAFLSIKPVANCFAVCKWQFFIEKLIDLDFINRFIYSIDRKSRKCRNLNRKMSKLKERNKLAEKLRPEIDVLEAKKSLWYLKKWSNSKGCKNQRVLMRSDVTSMRCNQQQQQKPLRPIKTIKKKEVSSDRRR